MFRVIQLVGKEQRCKSSSVWGLDPSQCNPLPPEVCFLFYSPTEAPNSQAFPPTSGAGGKVVIVTMESGGVVAAATPRPLLLGYPKTSAPRGGWPLTVCLQGSVLEWQKLPECDPRGHPVQSPHGIEEEAETLRQANGNSKKRDANPGL